MLQGVMMPAIDSDDMEEAVYAHPKFAYSSNSSRTDAVIWAYL